MKRSTYILVLFLSLSMLSRKRTYAQDQTPFADENVDDLEDVSDDFQENFFEALKQKGIQNYDRAILALNKCIQMEPDRDFLYFERAKNFTARKEYDRAEEDLEKSLSLKPNREPVLELLYDDLFLKRSTKLFYHFLKTINYYHDYKKAQSQLL